MIQRQENIRQKKHNQNITEGHDSRVMTPLKQNKMLPN